MYNESERDDDGKEKRSETLTMCNQRSATNKFLIPGPHQGSRIIIKVSPDDPRYLLGRDAKST